jgi:hypothetical protein
VVQALLHIVYATFNRLRGPAACSSSGSASSSGSRSSSCSPNEYLAMLTTSLGALGLLAVDKQARKHLIASRQGLSLLADVAALPASAFRHQVQEEQGEQQQELDMQGQGDGTVSASSVQKAGSATGAAAAAATSSQFQPGTGQASAGAATPGPVAAEATSAAQPVDEHAAVANADAGEREAAEPGEGSAAAAAAGEIYVTEEPPAIPVALLEMQPNQLAAEVLAAVLLRDASARALFLQSGNCRLLLQLLRAPDVRVQLCGAAAVARMASMPGNQQSCSQLAQQEPQLLRQMHSSVVQLLQQHLLQHSHQLGHSQTQAAGGCGNCGSQGADVISSCNSEENCQLSLEQLQQAEDSELQEMLLEYTCMALWVATAAVAPLFTKDEVLQQLADAGQLAYACLQLQGPIGLRPSVVCCLAGVLCVLAATKAVPEAAAELALGDANGPGGSSAAAAAGLVQTLQPFMLAVLQLEGTTDEVSKE